MKSRRYFTGENCVLALILSGFVFLPIEYQTVFAQSERHPITVDNVASLENLASIEFGVSRDAIWYPDGSAFVLSNSEGVWRVTVEDFRLSPQLIASRVVASLVLSGDGTRLAGRDNEAVYLWDANTGEELTTLELPYTDRLWLNYDGTVLVFTTQSLNAERFQNVLRVWNVDANREITAYEYASPIASFTMSSDGKTITTGHPDGSVNLRNFETGEEIFELSEYSGVVRELAFSSDGATLAIGGYSREIGIWHLYDGNYAAIRGLPRLADALALTSDGSIAATSLLLENEIYLWDTVNGSELGRLTGHSSDVTALAFSPDDTMLITSSLDNTLRLWAVPS